MLTSLARGSDDQEVPVEDDATYEVLDRLVSQGRAACVVEQAAELGEGWATYRWSITERGRLALSVCTNM